ISGWPEWTAAVRSSSPTSVQVSTIRLRRYPHLSPDIDQILWWWNNLVIRIAELVAARGQILVTHLVDRDLEGRARKRRDDLAVEDGIRRGRAEIAALCQVPDLARLRDILVHMVNDVLAGVVIDLLKYFAGNGIAQPYKLADDQLLQLRIIERRRPLLPQ